MIKKMFLALVAVVINLSAYSEIKKDDLSIKENIVSEYVNPQDTVKIYYLDEFVITSSVKETNNLKNMPNAVSVVTPQQLQSTQIESLPI